MQARFSTLRPRWRRQRRSSALAVVAVLALSIAASAAVFDLADGILLRPPDLPGAKELVTVNVIRRHYPSAASLGLVDTWRYAGIRGVQYATFTQDSKLARSGNYAGLVSTVGVSSGLLSMLHARPALGRGFAPQDENTGSAPVVLLSQQMFAAALGGDPALIGKAAVTINGVQCRVIGVMPSGFQVPTSYWNPLRPALWIPLPLYERIDGDAYGPKALVTVLARLTPDVNRGALQAQLNTMTLAHAKSHGQTWIQGSLVQSLVAATSDSLRPQILLLSGGAAAVLLLGFLNAACLLGAAGMERREERAIRMALGASPGRLRAQASAEGATLGLFGGLIGVLLAALSAPAVGALASFYLPWPSAAAPNWAMLGAMVLAAAVLGALAGATSGGAGMSNPRSGQFRLRMLAIAEMALSAALVAAAALVTISFVRLVNLPEGFSTQGVDMALMMQTNQPPRKPADAAAARAALVSRTLDAMRGQPALSAFAVSSAAPTVADSYSQVVSGWRLIPPDQRDQEVWFATPGFFNVLRIPVLEGSLANYRMGAHTAALDQAAALSLFGTTHAVGRRLSYACCQPGGVVRATVVAVVGNLRTPEGLVSINRTREVSHVYTASPDILGYIALLARSPQGSAAALHALAAVTSSLEPLAHVEEFGPLAYRQSHSQQTFQTAVALAFALLALLIGLTGVFALMARRVAAERGNLAVRAALGDTPAGLFNRVLREAAWLAVAGIATGLLLAWLLGGSLRALLFQVSPTDPWVLAAVALGTLLAAAAAAVIPAVRAARTDPNQLLRDA